MRSRVQFVGCSDDAGFTHCGPAPEDSRPEEARSELGFIASIEIDRDEARVEIETTRLDEYGSRVGSSLELHPDEKLELLAAGANIPLESYRSCAAVQRATAPSSSFASPVSAARDEGPELRFTVAGGATKSAHLRLAASYELVSVPNEIALSAGVYLEVDRPFPSYSSTGVGVSEREVGELDITGPCIVRRAVGGYTLPEEHTAQLGLAKSDEPLRTQLHFPTPEEIIEPSSMGCDVTVSFVSQLVARASSGDLDAGSVTRRHHRFAAHIKR